MKLTYTNYKGETSVRDFEPFELAYESSEFHPEPQFVLRAWDHDKQAIRSFALKDFKDVPIGTTFFH
jgi:predicted DNA-binding transcriptional regulator YafY